MGITNKAISTKFSEQIMDRQTLSCSMDVCGGLLFHSCTCAR